MKYYPSFHIVKTEDEARALTNYHNKTATPYMRKKHPAHYTPWSSRDGSETGFVVWYQYAR